MTGGPGHNITPETEFRWRVRCLFVFGALLYPVPDTVLLASDGNTTELRIGATISPTPCQYPRRCAPPPPEVMTRLVVSESTISYIGSPPTVIRHRGLLSILF